MRSVINIIKDRHFGVFESNRVKSGGKKSYILRLCEYKVFVDELYGRIGVYSAEDDLYLETIVVPFECDIVPLIEPIDTDMLNYFISNEMANSGDEDRDVAENKVLSTIAKLYDSPLVTEEVIEILKDKEYI